MAARWEDHILGPGDTAARPAFADVPKRALYLNTEDGELQINTGSAWTAYMSAAGALAGLSDVDVTGVADGDSLTWDDGASLWVPGPGGGGGGGGVLGLSIGASVPGGTTAGTLVFRKSDWIASLVADSPAALITLDETTSVFADQSGNARDFTAGTGVTRGLTALLGDSGKAASGDGSHPIATLGNAAGIVQTGTLEAWISLPSTNVAGNVMAVGTLAAGWGLNISNGAGSAGRLLCAVSPGVNYYSSGYTFPTGAGIYHVAMTLTAHAAVWYVNGVKVGNNTIGDVSPGAGLSIGSTGTGDALSSTVVVDHAVFFPTVVSAARIKQHAFQQPYSLLGWWDGSKLQPLGLV